MRGFIDAAHRLGLGVILDVVYNHFGPDANYLPFFSSTYITDKYENEWGDAVNFDGEGSAPVREFVRENAAYWVREFHFDGLRLDATQQIFDDFAAQYRRRADRRGARRRRRPRSVLVVAENEPQEARLVRPEPRGFGLDGVWNEDLHHASHVTLTARREAYYSDYTGSARELLACVKHGFLYQGQRSTWQKKPRGAPSLDIDQTQRVTFLENHDQVANSGFGKRLVDLTDRARLRAMTALLLLGPGTPMLFQGQEFASATPFLYFADHRSELAEAVAKGRREFLMQFPSLAGVELDAPAAAATFDKCVIDWSERAANAWAVRLHRDLIALRRDDPVLARAAKRADRRRRLVRGGVPGPAVRRARGAAARLQFRPRLGAAHHPRAAARSADGETMESPLVERASRLWRRWRARTGRRGRMLVCPGPRRLCARGRALTRTAPAPAEGSG